MSGRRAKAIRRAVYGDQSQRQARRYVALRNQRYDKDGEYVRGTILNHPDSLRAQYQRTKRGQ
jgi:hypothetical protein